MKIMIEIESECRAAVTISDRKLVLSRNGATSWFSEGLHPGDSDNTVGGMVSSKLHDVLLVLLEAFPAYSRHETWEFLGENAADRVYENLEL